MTRLNFVRGINRLGFVLAIMVAVPVFGLMLWALYDGAKESKEYSEWLAAARYLETHTYPARTRLGELKYRLVPDGADWKIVRDYRERKSIADEILDEKWENRFGIVNEKRLRAREKQLRADWQKAKKIVAQKLPWQYSHRTHLTIFGQAVLAAVICFVLIMIATFLLSKSIKYIVDGFRRD